LACTRIGEIALDHRQFGVLWQREARHLPPDQLAEAHRRLRDLGRGLAGKIAVERPEHGETATDLLAWSTIAVMDSVAFHHLTLPRGDMVQLMGELAGTVITTDLPQLEPAPATPPRGPLLARSRREVLLAQAVRMFARDGYTEVGIEDIGAAVGIAGPSVYNHFGSKAELLLTALRRGTAVLFMDLATIHELAADEAEALDRCLASYVRFALDHHDVVDLLITETRHVPDDEQEGMRQTQRDYVDEWSHLLGAVHPQLGGAEIRIRVHAALAVANDIARTPHLRRVDGIADALHAIGARLLSPAEPSV